MFEVYRLTSPSGKRYVGFTSQGSNRRWRKHVWDAENDSELPLHNAIRKHGPKSFTRTLLERMTTEAGAKRAEQLWIKELGTFGPGGYNLTAGGDGTLGYVVSAETRAKIGRANTGRSHSDETRAKMSESRLGKPLSPETCAKIGDAHRGKIVSSESRAKMSDSHLGKKQSPAAIAKTAAANRGRKHSPETIARMSASATLREEAKRKAKGSIP
jgi:group I intron endonuclease